MLSAADECIGDPDVEGKRQERIRLGAMRKRSPETRDHFQDG